ncbi:hypothetical protein [Pseudomonas sp. GM80]|uniref:hypothetical protein n=1 Tax=Pseudomonas sp. GM80 TaxID=1144339 RepID=UPI00026FB813|nr:hypothetical protein [Pseudomonas sp. GM80]EJN18250.1 hypothetical protein PMI37_05888 [Pseudomonas sp. GM80]
MEIAKCVLDNQIYTALDFSRLPPGELSNKRKHLVCIECQAPTFFRKASRHGHVACFGALAHIEGCSHSSFDTQNLIVESDNKYTTLHPNSFVELSSIATLCSDGDAAMAVYKKSLNTTNFHSLNDLKSSPDIRRELSATLKSLILSEIFKLHSPEVNSNIESKNSADHFFVKFEEVSVNQSEGFGGYFGMLTDARLSSEGALWLNSGGDGGVSCVIQTEMVDGFFRRYKLEDEEDLAGAYVTIIGSLKISQNGKKYIALADLDYIDLIRLSLDKDMADQFFLTKKAKIAFFLTHNKMGVFDSELGIKRKHYIDNDVAKEWRARFAKEFHPDKNQGDTSMDYNQILSSINKMYNRMVGKA